MPLLSTSAVSDWLTTSPGVFVLVAALALLLSAAGPAFSGAIDSCERSVRRRWGRRPGGGTGPRGIRLVTVDDSADRAGREVPPADVDA
jgi:hypothetical protein